MSSISFSKRDGIENQSHKNLDNPVIVVGMPRSGSTIFTRLLNESPDLLVLNDFYYLQHVESIGALKNTNQEISANLIAYVKDLLFRRINIYEKDDTSSIESGVSLNESQKLQIDNFIDSYSPENSEDWATILQTILGYSADAGGNKRWGYNTPQDYLNIELLQNKFPRAKFIFVLRQPKSMLSSYKNIFTHELNTNTRWRYHPVLQSLAWQASARTFLKFKKSNPNQFLLVRYEDMISQANETFIEIGKFLQVDFPYIDLKNFPNNSSFKNNDYTYPSDTEIWLGEKILKQDMISLGYESSNLRPRIQDIGTMILITLRASLYYLSQVVTSNDIRIRVAKLIRKLISK